MARNLEDMAVFARVVESGSLSLAAKALGSTRSAVSKSVARLERHLGARLLHRTTRQLSPTAAGQACYAHCSRIEAEARLAEQAAGELASEPSGRFRVTCSLALGLILAPRLPVFFARYPRLAAEVSLSEGVVDLVREGFDVAVRLGKLPDSSLVAKKLASYRRVIVASPSYLSRAGAPKTANELFGHQCLTRIGQSQWKLNRATVRVQSAYQADTPELLRQAALQGAGLAMLPSFLVDGDLHAGRLVPVLEALAEPAAIYALYPHARQLPPSTRVFVDFLGRTLADTTPTIGSLGSNG